MMDNSLFQWRLLPLWLGFALMLLPFLLNIRVGELSSFYLESGSLSAAILFVLMSVIMFWQQPFSGSLKTHAPLASIYFLVLAIFWATQARIMHLPYIGLSDIVAWAFVVYALLAWACRGWVLRFGQERVVSILAWTMTLAACLQATVAWLQYTGAAASFSHFLLYHQGIAEGQLGQYNHLGHFLMWGILAIGYLWGERRARWYFALPIGLYLTMTTGIVQSRTLMAYVLAMLILLPIWRVWVGKSANRVVLGLGLATAGVVLAQFTLEYAVHLFNDNIQLNNSLERLSHSSHSGSGRSYEWKKAWLVFQSAPIWGHGWGSYPSQSFLLDSKIYPAGFRQYDPHVLFTHSHNSFLNLLAEMGIVGTVLILGGLLWVIKGCLKAKNAPSLLILALMTVSLTHSFLEYPLWYLYFLTLFATFTMLTPAKPNDIYQTHYFSKIFSQEISTKNLKTVQILIVTLLISMMINIIRLGFVYQDFVITTEKNATTYEERITKITKLINLSRTEPMLAHYADLTLVKYTPMNTESVPMWANLAGKSISFRPYAHAGAYALILARQGKIDQAKHWLIQSYRYYPEHMQAYGRDIMLTPYYPDLRQTYTSECQAYRRITPQATECAEPLPPKPQ